jgi:hypothetical protein
MNTRSQSEDLIDRDLVLEVLTLVSSLIAVLSLLALFAMALNETGTAKSYALALVAVLVSRRLLQQAGAKRLLPGEDIRGFRITLAPRGF